MNRKRLIAALLCLVLIMQMGITALAVEYDDASFDEFNGAFENLNDEGLNAYNESVLPEDFFTGDERAVGTRNEIEDNNTMASATITSNDYNNYGTIHTTTDVDYWKITLPKGNANFWIETPSQGQYYQYEVLDSSRRILGRTTPVNKLVKLPLSAGTYYVKVYTDPSFSSPAIRYLFRCKSYPFTATIMQGNTARETDCRAAYSGLTDGGYKNIATHGWSYTDKTHSSILDKRATEAQFVAAKDYDVAYFSGHGGAVSSMPAINVNASQTYGTYSVIQVAKALGVSTDSWKSTAVWKPSDTIRVLMLAACSQLTDTNAKYYARIMRASGIRAIAGYYGTGPGHETDTWIAEDFFEKAAEGTSVYGAWKEANDANGDHPWAVLVYNEYSNQYYRLPGYPGNTYTTPSSTAQVYLYSKANSNGSVILSNPIINEIQEDLPLAFSLRPEARLAAEADDSRDPVYTDETLLDMTDDAIFELSELAGGVDAYSFPIRECGVVRKELDEEGNVIYNSEITVEREYTMYDMYRGVKVVDSFVSVSYDSDGINSVINRWKDIHGEYAIESVADGDMQQAERVSEAEVLSIAEDYALGLYGEEPFEVYSTNLAYAPADEGVYELAYEVATSCGVYYVSVQTGNIL